MDAYVGALYLNVLQRTGGAVPPCAMQLQATKSLAHDEGSFSSAPKQLWH